MVQQGKLCWIGSTTWRKLLPLTFFVFVSVSANAAEISPTVSKATAPPWEKLSDQQIARLFFPKEKLYFQPTLEGLPMLETEPLDGVAVYEIKRVVANFDNDPEDELVVLIIFSTELLYAEYTKVIFAILDIGNGEIKIRWRTEEGEAFANAPLDISAIRLINEDKFFALACTYDSSHAGMGSSYQKMKVIRWNGKNFSEIWSYNLRSYDSGGRGGIPHEYSATVDFLDTDKTAKRIRVGATFTYHHNNEHLRKQYKLNEEFTWNEKEQKYLPLTSRKASPLPLLEVHRVGLPSAKEFPLFVIRDLRSEGLDKAGQWEVVMVVERSRGDRNAERAIYVLKIDMHKPALISQQSFPLRETSPNEPPQSSTLRSGNVRVNPHDFSPEVSWFNHRKREYQSSLLDAEALISTHRAILFDLADTDMPGIAIVGTRIPNPILETLNEDGLFLYVWNGQKYVLEKKRAFPKKTQKGNIEAFILLSPGVGGKNNPAGVFISYEDSYHNGLYIFR